MSASTTPAETRPGAADGASFLQGTGRRLRAKGAPRLIAGKFIRFVVTILVVTFFTTLLMKLIPGNPAYLMAGPGAPQSEIDAITQKYHFNDNVFQQYASWLSHAIRGDLGTSHITQLPVTATLAQRLPVTLELAILAVLIGLVLAVPLAIVCATRPGSRLDQAMSALGFGAVSLPSFVIALLLVYVFAVTMHVFPVIGWTPLTENVWQNLRGAALPVTAIAIGQVVVFQRVLRADLIGTTQEDFIALARAKGLSTNAIMWKHALKPASFSLITLSGLSLASLLGGTVLVEQIFVLPGLGSNIVNAITDNDFPMVQGEVAFIAVAFLVINFAVDILYGVLDPRTRTKAIR